MTEEIIKNLLQQADRIAGPPTGLPSASDITRAVRRRAAGRRIPRTAAISAAAAVLLIALTIAGLAVKTKRTKHREQRIAGLEKELQYLQARTDSVINLVHEVLEKEREQRRLDEIHARVASISDPLEKFRREVDRTAFILIYEADRMYDDREQRNSAIQAYQRVIKLFPETQWAEKARQKLSQIRKTKTHKSDSKGDLLWKPQKRPSLRFS